MLVCKLESFLGVICNLPYRERQKKEADDSHKMSVLNLQNLKACTEALTRFSHVYHLDGLNTMSLSQGHALGAVSENREGKQNAHSKDPGRE